MMTLERLNRLDFGYCLAPLIGAAIIGGAAAIGSTVYSNWKNEQNVSATNESNRDISRENREWQEAMVEKTWAREDALRNEANEREDTALTRAVADAKNAGLSPLAVVNSGGAGTASNPSTASVSGEAPIPAQSYTVQPMDFSEILGSFASQANLDEMARHNKATESQAQDELKARIEQANAELQLQASQFAQTMEQTDSHFMLQYEQSASQFSAQLSQQQVFHYDDLNDRDKQRAFDSFQSQNMQTVDLALEFSRSTGVRTVFKPYTSYTEYSSAMDKLQGVMISGNRAVLNMVGEDPDAFLSSETLSNGQSTSNGVSVGLGTSNSGSSSVPAGTGNAKKGLLGKVSSAFGFNANGSASQSQSTNDLYSYTKSDEYLREKIQQKYGGVLEVPILVRSYGDFNRDYGYLNKAKK